MPDPSEIQRDLMTLEAELKKLEAEYNMFFSGRAPRPPWETRARVEALVKRWDRGHIDTAAERFRFSTLQSRFQTFADLWDHATEMIDIHRRDKDSRDIKVVSHLIEQWCLHGLLAKVRDLGGSSA